MHRMMIACWLCGMMLIAVPASAQERSPSDLSPKDEQLQQSAPKEPTARRACRRRSRVRCRRRRQCVSVDEKVEK